MRPWLEQGKNYESPWEEFGDFCEWLHSQMTDDAKDELTGLVESELYGVFAGLCDTGESGPWKDGNVASTAKSKK